MSENKSLPSINNWLDDLNRDPDHLEAAVNLGNYYYDNNDAAQSIVYYTIALQINPDQPSVQTDLGTMYWRNGNVSHAEKMFRAVIAKHPNFSTAYLNLGLLLVRAKDQPQEGRALWQKIVDDFSQDPSAQRAKALLLETFQ